MTIHIQPNPALIDQPVHIRITGLKPHQHVTIRASRTAQAAQKNVYLTSYADFQADSNGEVDLANQAPISGTYTGVDPMGLFWSLQINREESRNNTDFIGQVVEPQTMNIQVESSHKIVESTTLTRLWHTEDIRRVPVRDNGLVATLFCPKEGSSRPGVIFVSGSEGGLNEFMPALLASHGFSTLSLAYFRMEHLPKRCADIPLEYVQTAIEWMQSRKEVTPQWMGIHGTSKGAQLALLSALHFKQIKAVVCLNGSIVHKSGIVPWSDADTLPPSFTYKGMPIFYVTPNNPKEVALTCLRMQKSGEGNPLDTWYRHLETYTDLVEKATIPLENIHCPMLFVRHGSAGRIDREVERLTARNHPYELAHHNYEDATHAMGIPYVYVSMPGKNPKDTALASADSWMKTKEFFKRNSDS